MNLLENGRMKRAFTSRDLLFVGTSILFLASIFFPIYAASKAAGKPGPAKTGYRVTHEGAEDLRGTGWVPTLAIPRDIPTEWRSYQYTGPTTVAVGEEAEYYAAIETKGASQRETDKTKKLRVTPTMHVELKTTSPSVVHIHSGQPKAIQPIEDNYETRWSWKVRIDQEGTYKLTFVFSLVEGDDKGKFKTVEVKETSLSVTATWWRRAINHIASSYTLVSACLGGMVVWLGFGKSVREWFDKREQSKQEKKAEKERKARDEGKIH